MLDWEMCVESSMDLAYLINMSNSRSSVPCDLLNTFFKQKEIQLKILNIEASNKVMTSVIVDSSMYDEVLLCKKELTEALQHVSAFTVDPSKMEITAWRSVCDPADESKSAMMGVVLADPRIYLENCNRL